MRICPDEGDTCDLEIGADAAKVNRFLCSSVSAVSISCLDEKHIVVSPFFVSTFVTEFEACLPTLKRRYFHDFLALSFRIKSRRCWTFFVCPF